MHCVGTRSLGGPTPWLRYRYWTSALALATVFHIVSVLLLRRLVFFRAELHAGALHTPLKLDVTFWRVRRRSPQIQCIVELRNILRYSGAAAETAAGLGLGLDRLCPP